MTIKTEFSGIGRLAIGPHSAALCFSSKIVLSNFIQVFQKHSDIFRINSTFIIKTNLTSLMNATFTPNLSVRKSSSSSLRRPVLKTLLCALLVPVGVYAQKTDTLLVGRDAVQKKEHGHFSRRSVSIRRRL